MSKLLKSVTILFAICWLLLTCHASEPTEVKRPPLKVACAIFVGNAPAIIAQKKGFFKAQGIDVELSYVKYSQLQRADFSAGKYDGIGGSLGGFISLSATNPDMQTVMVVDESIGADVVVAQSHIRTVADLKGQNLGVSLGGFSEIFVAEMLKTANLTSDDVNLVKFDAVEVAKGLKINTIQAGHTWEPHLSEALKLGGHILFSSKQTPGLILDVLTFRGEAIRERPEDIRAFIRGWLQALNYWEANVKEGNAIISKELNFSTTQLSIDGINLTNLEENKKFFESNSSHSIYKTAKKNAEFFIRSGNITRLPELKTLFNSSFLYSPNLP
ncbi:MULTISPECIES: ABC transporter substrate-binding protein [unclassified Microcoleus]|uniref:ABC transporter substrate-binding protein n=1 Tax=unclassified Microcoleus TaxID=2642155 RepID=UPI002FD2FD69